MKVYLITQSHASNYELKKGSVPYEEMDGICINRFGAGESGVECMLCPCANCWQWWRGRAGL
jgi:hypothetical protein